MLVCAARPGSTQRSTADLVVAGCLAAFAVTAGVRIIMSRSAVERTPGVAAVGGESAAAVNVSSPASPTSPVSSSTSASEAGPPFQVEVLDANGKRWMLWFVHNGSKNGADQIYSKRTEFPNSSGSTTKTAKHDDATLAETSQGPRTFTLVVPRVNRPTNSDSAAGGSCAAL